MSIKSIIYISLLLTSSATGADTLKISVSSGWNLIALPVVPTDARSKSVFPSAISDAFIYRQSYQQVDSLFPGHAYWIKFDSAMDVPLIGTTFTEMQTSRTSGWSLLGGISIPILRSELRTTPDGIISGDLYQFGDGGYSSPAMIEPGKGYWVHLSGPGTIEIFCWNKDSAIVSPLHEASLLSSPILKWKGSTCGNQFRLQVSEDSAFTILVTDSLLSDTTYAFPFTCLHERYFWRVGLSTEQNVIWSNSHSFRWAYADSAYIVPQDSSDVSETPLVRWRRADCADGYQFQLASDSLFSSIILDTVLSDSAIQLDSLPVRLDYWWRMRIKIGENETPWLSRFTFHTVRWEYVGLGTESVHKVVFDWANPAIVYAVSSSNFSLGTVGGIFKSIDRGVSWDTLVRGITGIDIDMDPYDSSTLFVTGGINYLTGAGIIKTTNGGIDWSNADSGIYIDAEQGPVVVTIDPQNSNIVYAGTNGFFGGTLYKSIDGGMFWSKAVPDNNGDLHSGIGTIDIAPDNSNIIYVTSTWQSLLYRSFDASSTWQKVQIPSRVSDAEFSQHYSDSIYAATYNGMMLSTDGGSGWFLIRSGLPDSFRGGPWIHFIDSSATKEMIISVDVPFQSYQAFWTRDGGLHWQPIPLPPTKLFRTVRSPGRILYGCTRNGVFRYDK